MRLRDVFSKLMWDPREDLSGSVITYVDRRRDPRGTTITRLTEVAGSRVMGAERGVLIIEQEGEVSHIPFHRIVEVRSASGERLWSRAR